MSNIKTNERELSSKVAEWFQQAADQNILPFKVATNEPGIKVDARTKFGDVVLWRNRQTRDAFSYLELKPPFAQKENLITFREKANQLKVKYAYTWDFQTLNVYHKKDNFENPIGSEATPILSNIIDWLRGDKQATIKTYIQRICDELISLDQTGKFTQFKPEKIYFVNFIKETVDQLLPLFEQFINQQYGKKEIREKLIAYFSKQGYIFTNREEYVKLITKQRVYGLVTKIIFYLTIKKYFDDLPDIYETSEKDLNKSLKTAFVKAQERDWQAVFEDDLIEDLGIPKSSFSILREFFSELRVYHFENLPDDVIGELFEEIIDPEQRHDLGQYFTNEYLVDLILAAVVNDEKGYYLDPTCGSGTFLIRLYDRLHYLSGNHLTHTELLEKIWGFDIGKFPAELSTINLFRQSPKNFENFPRVLSRDIFDVNTDQKFKFPPPKAGRNFKKVEIELPQFSAIVGNFPFIRQELIEKTEPGYKQYLTKVLAKEYLFSYKKLFVLKNINLGIYEEVGKYEETKRNKHIDKWVESGNVQLNLSGQADIYTYIFIHTATLLAQKGSFAIITSNSWLDVAYGTVLKEFLLDHFKIKMVIASWAEPWFEDAAVNTVVSIMEKEEDESLRNNNKIKFVKLKQKLSEIIPYNDLKLEKIKRWQRAEDLITKIENCEYWKNNIEITKTIISCEDETSRIRIVDQRILKNEIKDNVIATKWIQYLRAPNIYFEILEKANDKLDNISKIGSINRGITTGINEFFYYSTLDKKTLVNKRGYRIEKDNDFFIRVITSPKEIETIDIKENLISNYVFICEYNKRGLKKSKHDEIIRLIEWGEKQRTQNGLLWSKVPSVSNRQNWWSIDIERKEKIMFPRFIDKKFCFPNLSKNSIAGDTFFEFTPLSKKGYKNKIFINSTVYHLFVETMARSNMGDGVLTFYGPDIEKTLLLKDDVKLKYQKSIDRTILPIFDEIKQKDRKELDSAVLKALGLNPKEYLPKLYAGICEMVNERLSLAKMRKTRKKQSVKSEYDNIKKSVIDDIFEDGFLKFPENFLSQYNKLKFTEIPTTGKHLSYEPFFDKFIIKDTDKKRIFETTNKNEAEFAVIISYQKQSYMLNIPVDEEILNEIISKYYKYLNDTRSKILVNANQKLHDHALAEKMTKEILIENNLIEL